MEIWDATVQASLETQGKSHDVLIKILESSCIPVVLLALFVAISFEPRAAVADDWPTATPTEVGLDPAPLEALAKMIESDPLVNTHSVLVIKDGKLVFERYFSGPDQDWGEDLGVVAFDANTLHDLRSISKSVTSALVGIAIGEGKLPGPEADAFTLFPDHHEQLAPDKHRLELQHILAMTAGLDWFEPADYTNPGNDEIRLMGSPDPVTFVLGRSFVNEPGSEFAYNGGLPTLLGHLLERAYGKPGDTATNGGSSASKWTVRPGTSRWVSVTATNVSSWSSLSTW